ncbi:AAA family ATPase [Streptomyces sp. NY05-11A]|uniref:AAA family ATPase n=1 Tax=Streptomyces soliscabiei TaxID=588897 RepID=UPI0039F67891
MAFRQQNPFCSVDLIPAGRFFGLSASAQIDLEPLQWHRIEDERNSQARSETLSSGLVGMGEVTRYLAAIDYKWFMAQRANEPISDDYGAIAELLLGATGKTLLRPVMNQENTGVQIQVELPSGNVHGIHQLSSGEIEVLGLIYFVRRLASQGGVLLIDEPEQHLHPSLQAVLFEAAKSLSGRSQLIAATHSVKLISSVGSSAILQLKSPASGDENQVSKFEDQSAKIDLIANLGMTAADILQNDLMVVVEGKTDGPWLQELFPVELGRAHVRVAGNFHEVLAAHRMLNESPSGIPWICLSDRDLMSDSDLTALKEKYPQLHVWPRRAIESMLLEPNLLRAVLRSAGLRKTEDESLEILRNAADGLKQEVLKQLVTREIAKRFPAPEKPSEGSNVEKLEEHWISYAAVAQERASAVRRVQEEKSEELDARWDGEWQSLVEPKAALRRVSAEVRIFSKHAHLVNSLIHVAASEPELMPGGFAEFRSLLRSCLGLG